MEHTKDFSLPHGLDAQQVAERKAAGKVNKVREKVGKSYLRIVTDNLFTFFNLVWAIVAFLMIMCREYSNLTFLAVIIPNVLIAIIQECRAKATVERLSVNTAPKATVVRDGSSISISSDEVVQDDVMILVSGQQITADSVVLSGLAEVNESMLTGESDAVRKTEGDRVLAGSFLVSGSIVVRVCAVGKENYIHKIEKAARSFSAPVSDLFADLNRVLKYIAIFMIPTALAIFLLTLTGTDATLVKAITTTCGAVIGMVPAGMYLLVTVTLTVSVMSLGRKKTLVRDMYSIEMLARADVICLDKTGTVTDGTMLVTDVLPLGARSDEEIARIMSLIEGTERSINATARALIDRFGTANDDPTLDKIPFSSERKHSQVTFERAGTFSLGAPHFVRCPISAQTEERIMEFADRGRRVLILAEHDRPDEEGKPIALIAITDRIRPNAADTIAKFQAQGVTVKLISGDHPATVSAIAKRVGVKDADKYLVCAGLSDEELEAAAEDYAVFGRVTPEQKVLLVRRLKALGHTVAMTGDGVNDTLAFKESNCAIAMAEGCEMARKVAQIVLLHSDFAALPSIVREGRRCINNVTRSSTLFLMKTVLAVALSLFTVITGLLGLIPFMPVSTVRYPFEPKGLVLLEVFVIGIASVLLALEPNDERIRGSFIRRVLMSSVPKGLTLVLPVVAILVLESFGLFADCGTTMAMIAVLSAGFANLVLLSIPYTVWRAVVTGVMAVSLAAAIPLSVFALKDMFGFRAVTGHLPAVLAVVGASVAFAVISHFALPFVQWLRRRKQLRNGTTSDVRA